MGAYLPLRQVSEAGHGGQAAEDPGELGVLRDLRGTASGSEGESTDKQRKFTPTVSGDLSRNDRLHFPESVANQPFVTSPERDVCK